MKGLTYLLSRRCAQRQHLLRPDKDVEQIYLYCLAEAARRFNVAILGWKVMSNHHHAVIWDRDGRLSEFLEHLHKLIAKAMNALRDRWENFWAAEKASAVRLVNAEDRFEKLMYVLMNPVAADLVDQVADWPGASSFSQMLSGKKRVVKRPSWFFAEDSTMPEQVELAVERPEGFEKLSGAEWSKRVLDEVRKREKAARLERQRNDRGVKGRKAVLEGSWKDYPSTAAPRRQLRPEFACKNPKDRAAVAVGLKEFRRAYRVALQAWRTGDRSAVFPYGTYAMVVVLGAPCGPPPPLMPN
ncbi:MAG: transposase [Rubrivivax sp.]